MSLSGKGGLEGGGGGASLTLGAVGAAPNTAGATLSAGVLNLEPASATMPGVMTTGTQTIAGAKTFSSTLTTNSGIVGGSTLVHNGLYSAGGTTGITAFAGGGQGSATLLTKSINFVTTVANANDSVKLASASIGTYVVVYNLGANALNIFPSSGQAIDALGTNAAYSLAAGASREFWGQASNQWRSR